MILTFSVIDSYNFASLYTCEDGLSDYDDGVKFQWTWVVAAKELISFV
jgi:hypothetical protein